MYTFHPKRLFILLQHRCILDVILLLLFRLRQWTRTTIITTTTTTTTTIITSIRYDVYLNLFQLSFYAQRQSCKRYNIMLCECLLLVVCVILLFFYVVLLVVCLFDSCLFIVYRKEFINSMDGWGHQYILFNSHSTLCYFRVFFCCFLFFIFALEGISKYREREQVRVCVKMFSRWWQWERTMMIFLLYVKSI